MDNHYDTLEVAVFGGGCFWCTEAIFAMLKGVISVAPGYAGGTTDRPTYEQVCSGNTGHAEVIRIEYHPSQITYEDLLTVFFATHDPTSKNRQGNDVGTQYRSVILTTSQQQQQTAEAFVRELNASEHHGKFIVTDVEPLTQFFPAEESHKEYYARNKNNGYCQVVIEPKLEKVRHHFQELVQNNSQ